MIPTGAWRRDTLPFRLTVLMLTALVARAVTFGSPLVHVDETFYLAVSQAMTHGALPYVDLWDRKPVGLFLIYLPAAICGLPVALYVYQAMAVAAVVATALLVARLATEAGWRTGALPAGMLYVLWLDLADGQGGQSPVFYNLLMAAAALLTLAGARGNRRKAVAAMLLVGLALQVKYSALFEGIGFGLWLLAGEWQRTRRLGDVAAYGAVLCLVALVPTALAAAAYAAMGHLDDFIFANFISILQRKPDDAALQLTHARDSAFILLPLLLVFAGQRAAALDPVTVRTRLFVRLWLMAALAAFVGFGSWYNHYTLPVMLPGAVALAALFERREHSWLWAAVPLALMAVAGQTILQSERHRRGTPAEFDALARTVGRGPGGMFVYSGPVLLYAVTGRPALSRYIFPSHLEFLREAGSIGVDQRAEIGRIFAATPAVVVMGPPIHEEDPAIRELVLRCLRDGGYQAGAPVTLGRDAILVYRRSASR